MCAVQCARDMSARFRGLLYILFYFIYFIFGIFNLHTYNDTLRCIIKKLRYVKMTQKEITSRFTWMVTARLLNFNISKLLSTTSGQYRKKCLLTLFFQKPVMRKPRPSHKNSTPQPWLTCLPRFHWSIVLGSHQVYYTTLSSTQGASN